MKFQVKQQYTKTQQQQKKNNTLTNKAPVNERVPLSRCHKWKITAGLFFIADLAFRDCFSYLLYLILSEVIQIVQFTTYLQMGQNEVWAGHSLGM